MPCYFSDDFVLFHYNFQAVWFFLYARIQKNTDNIEQKIIESFKNKPNLPPFSISWDFTLEKLFFDLQNLFENNSTINDSTFWLSAEHISVTQQIETATQIWLYAKIKIILEALKQHPGLSQKNLANNSWPLRKILNNLTQLNLPYLSTPQQDTFLNILYELYEYKMTIITDDKKKPILPISILHNLNKTLTQQLQVFPNTKRKELFLNFCYQNLLLIESSQDLPHALYFISSLFDNFFLFLRS